MDSLKEQVSNLTLYDLKAGVRKVQNGEFCSSLQNKLGMISRLLTAVYSCYELYRNGGEGMLLFLSSVAPPIPESPPRLFAR